MIMARRSGSTSSPAASSPRAVSRSSSSRTGSPASPPIPRSSKRRSAAGADYDAVAEGGRKSRATSMPWRSTSDSRSRTSSTRPTCSARSTTRRNAMTAYVSLEVSPYLAMNTEATVAEARRLWKAVGRDNLMVKVPATKAGLPAIRQLIGEGINVNITLLFSQQVYEEVVEAYLAGLRTSDRARRRCEQDCERRQLLRQPHRRCGGQAHRRAPCARRTTTEGAVRLPGCAARSRSPTPSSPTSATSGFSPARAGRSCVPRARACSGCFGRAPGPRTRTTATCSMSRS